MIQNSAFFKNEQRKSEATEIKIQEMLEQVKALENANLDVERSVVEAKRQQVRLKLDRWIVHVDMDGANRYNALYEADYVISILRFCSRAR